MGPVGRDSSQNEIFPGIIISTYCTVILYNLVTVIRTFIPWVYEVYGWLARSRSPPVPLCPHEADLGSKGRD